MPTTARGAPSSPPPPSRPLVLVAVSGDLPAGEEVPIPLTEPLAIGRAAGGLQLTDPLVSIHHARVFYDEKRGYVVEDLRSATGTWVDEEQVRGESRPLGVGTRLRFGDTMFEVVPVHRRPGWVKWVVALTLVIGFFDVLLFLSNRAGQPPSPDVPCPEAGLVGAIGIESVRPPPEFLRERALLVSDLTCYRITDEDDDGRAEAWLRATDGREFVVVPGEEQGWTLLGELPPNCATRSGSDLAGEFPVLDCADEEWMFVDGVYRFVRQNGVVVWYRETEGAPAAAPAPGAAPAPPGPTSIALPGVNSGDARGPIKVGRFAPRGDRLGAFLSFRGVDRPIHYLICEEAFEGIAAQALMDDESVTQLRIGCISDLQLLGGPPAKPLAIALTPAGRRALVDDVTTFYAGNPDGLFLDPRWSDLVAEISADPGFLVGARKLLGDTKESDAPPMSPFPDAARTVDSAHVLEPKDSRWKPAAISSTVTIVREGEATVDPPGCSVLQVHISPFARYGLLSLGTGPFLTVTETGCGEPKLLASVDYVSGSFELPLDGVDARLVTERASTLAGREMVRARLTWREAAQR
jgi:hypothetical protein